MGETDPGAKPKRRLSTKKRLTFMVLTLSVLLGGAELFFQVRRQIRQARKPRIPTRPDPYTGIALKKNARYERADQNRRATINALGFRGAEVGPKQPGRLRIACAGGSTTYGLYASDDDKTWPFKLGQRLSERGHSVEVLNFGCPGWTSRSSATNLERKGYALQPDVIVVYHAYNDLMSNLEDAYVERSEVDDPEQLKSPLPTASYLEYSALLDFIASRIRKGPKEALKEKQDAFREQNVAAFKRNLRRIVRRGGEVGARVFLCTFPTCYRPTLERSRQDQVPAIETWYELCPMTYPNLMKGLVRYNAAVREVASETAATLIVIQATYPMDVKLYASPLHHSDPGEELVANYVADALEQSGALAAGSK